MAATVWSRDGCRPCAEAMEMLTDKGVGFQALKLGRDFTREEFFEKFGKGATVPKILLDDRMVNGTTELRRILES